MRTPPPTPDEELLQVLNETTQLLKRLEGRVSEQREHSIGTHLKMVVRCLGFRPAKGWQEKDYLGLHKSTVAAFASIQNQIPEGREDFTLMVAKTTLSNLKAEVKDLLEAPEPLKELPEPTA